MKDIKVKKIIASTHTDGKNFVLVETTGKIKYVIVRPSKWIEHDGSLSTCEKIKSSRCLKTIVIYWCYNINKFVRGADKYVYDRLVLDSDIRPMKFYHIDQLVAELLEFKKKYSGSKFVSNVELNDMLSNAKERK
jgi:hypothetical protein